LNLADFDIDPNQGFLPNPDHLTKLPSLFRPSDELGKAMPSLLDDKKFRPAVQKLPLLFANRLNNGHELKRAMLLAFRIC
jgi:hypothetical protein